MQYSNVIFLHIRPTTKKVVNLKMEAFSLTVNVNISVNFLSNLTTKDIDSFRISFSWGFWNCPWLLDLIKSWWRYWQLKRRLPFSNWPLFYVVAVDITIVAIALTGLENYLSNNLNPVLWHEKNHCITNKLLFYLSENSNFH